MSIKRPTTKSISTSCSKAIEDGKCRRLINHKGDCRTTLKQSTAPSTKVTSSPQTIVNRVNRRNRPKAVKGNYKFVIVGGTKFRVTVSNSGEATLTKVVRELRAVPSDRVVAASTKSVSRRSYRNSGRPTLARPSVG